MAMTESRGRAFAAWLGQRGGALTIFVLLFVVWEVAVRLTGIKEYLLPPPSKVWTEFWKRHEIVAGDVGIGAEYALALQQQQLPQLVSQ